MHDRSEQAEAYVTEVERLRAAFVAITEGRSRSECRRIAHEALGHVLVQGEHTDEWVMPSDPAEATPPDSWGK